jgi:hypothetical protein
MKTLLVSLLFVFSSVSLAAPIDGQIFYTLPSGEYVERDVTIEVPSRGEGEVVLSGNNFEWRTANFTSYTKNGQTVFIAAFQTEFREFKSTTVLKGTYIKGSNKIVYYGDMYKKNGLGEVDLSLEKNDFSFTGGFRFSYER